MFDAAGIHTVLRKVSVTRQVPGCKNAVPERVIAVVVSVPEWVS